MPREFSRTRRVGDQIQRELAELIRDEIRDPRVGSVTVSGVEVTRDLAHAKVYVTVLGVEGADNDVAVDVLNRAAGFLRGALGRRMKIRTVPALKFYYDPSFDRGARLSKLIDEAVSEDEQKHH